MMILFIIIKSCNIWNKPTKKKNLDNDDDNYDTTTRCELCTMQNNITSSSTFVLCTTLTTAAHTSSPRRGQTPWSSPK